ncbi:protein MAIN-LIKE 2-like [Arachis ipaensis]|uniref:protein MAIN-LIKE 2-like n=1 Tax=Arachis ipaensis TaxID=130454 RepID=UPI000A2B8EDB|nr:protein MAIN-LIKE 2-like [Arachis ipaensis]
MESLRYLICDHPLPPNRYNDRVEEHLRFIGFLHVSQIRVVQCQKALVNALVERWHPNTHTFHLRVGECAVTLEDVAVIFGLPTDVLPVTWMIMSSFEALEAECLQQFGVAPKKSDCRASCIKLTWLRDLKERLQLVDETSMQSIGQYSLGSACLAHLYRSLCRASRFDCKKIDGPLELLLT